MKVTINVGQYLELSEILREASAIPALKEALRGKFPQVPEANISKAAGYFWEEWCRFLGMLPETEELVNTRRNCLRELLNVSDEDIAVLDVRFSRPLGKFFGSYRGH